MVNAINTSQIGFPCKAAAAFKQYSNRSRTVAIESQGGGDHTEELSPMEWGVGAHQGIQGREGLATLVDPIPGKGVATPGDTILKMVEGKPQGQIPVKLRNGHFLWYPIDVLYTNITLSGEGRNHGGKQFFLSKQNRKSTIKNVTKALPVKSAPSLSSRKTKRSCHGMMQRSLLKHVHIVGNHGQTRVPDREVAIACKNGLKVIK